MLGGGCFGQRFTILVRVCNCRLRSGVRFSRRLTRLTMKPINKDELYEHLNRFLQAKGIELKEGSYAKGIQKGFSLLTDAINLSQKGIQRAKAGIDKKVDQMRQVIHEHTAPKPASNAPAPEGPPVKGVKVPARTGSRKSQARKRAKARRKRS